jgi:hypothetical protein
MTTRIMSIFLFCLLFSFSCTDTQQAGDAEVVPNWSRDCLELERTFDALNWMLDEISSTIDEAKFAWACSDETEHQSRCNKLRREYDRLMITVNQKIPEYNDLLNYHSECKVNRNIILTPPKANPALYEFPE